MKSTNQSMRRVTFIPSYFSKRVCSATGIPQDVANDSVTSFPTNNSFAGHAGDNVDKVKHPHVLATVRPVSPTDNPNRNVRHLAAGGVNGNSSEPVIPIDDEEFDNF